MAVLRVFVCLCGEPCRKGCTVNVRSGRLTCIAGGRNPEQGKVLKREKCFLPFSEQIKNTRHIIQNRSDIF